MRGQFTFVAVHDLGASAHTEGEAGRQVHALYIIVAGPVVHLELLGRWWRHFANVLADKTLLLLNVVTVGGAREPVIFRARSA